MNGINKYLEILSIAAYSSNPDKKRTNLCFSFNDTKTLGRIKSMAISAGIKLIPCISPTDLQFEHIEGIKYFDDEEEFFSICKDLIKNDNQDYYCYFSKKEHKLIIFDNSCKSKSYYLVKKRNGYESIEYKEASNAYYWEKIYELLKIKKIGDEYNHTFIIQSNNTGISKYEYEIYSQSFNDIDFEKLYHNFEKIIDDLGSDIFILKDEIAKYSVGTDNNLISCFFLHLDSICKKVRINFEIVKSNKNMENEKNIFFERLDAIIDKTKGGLEKIASSIFSIPLTYASALFSLQSTQQNTGLKEIFSFALWVYTIATIIFLIYEMIESICLRNKFKKIVSNYTDNKEKLKQEVSGDSKNISFLMLITLIGSILLIVILLILRIKISKFLR